MHPGFLTAFLAVGLPLLVLCCCCLARACRRKGVREGLKQDSRRDALLDGAASDGAGTDTDGADDSAPNESSDATRDDGNATSTAESDAPQGEVAVPTYMLPVDAYYGVPKTQTFHI